MPILKLKCGHRLVVAELYNLEGTKWCYGCESWQYVAKVIEKPKKGGDDSMEGLTTLSEDNKDNLREVLKGLQDEYDALTAREQDLEKQIDEVKEEIKLTAIHRDSILKILLLQGKTLEEVHNGHIHLK